MAWLAPAAQGIATLATGIGNLFGQKHRQRDEFRQNQLSSNRAFKRDLAMWNAQNEHNMKLWNLQNEYNLPANQMQRLQDAGLNPALIYGNAAAGGQAAAIRSAETPKYQAPRANFNYTPLRAPDVLSAYQNFEMRQAQIDNLKAQEDLTNQKALTEVQMRDPRYYKAIHESTIKYVDAKYADVMRDLEERQRSEVLAKTQAERGLRQEELKWMRDFGMRPGDPLFYRWLAKFKDMFPGWIGKVKDMPLDMGVR